MLPRQSEERAMRTKDPDAASATDPKKASASVAQSKSKKRADVELSEEDLKKASGGQVTPLGPRKI